MKGELCRLRSLCKATEDSGNDKFLIDGFPRDEENRIVFENVGREDDNLETLKKRFKVFVESTLPVVSYYESKGKLRRLGFGSLFSMIILKYYQSLFFTPVFDYFHINAAKPSEEVFKAVKVLFASAT